MKRNKLNGLEIKNQSQNSADLYIYGDICSDDWEKWTDQDLCPQDMIDFLDSVKDVGKLNIYVQSGGGSVFAGMAMYNMLRRHKAYKTVYVDGLAGSISSIIALVGDKIIIPANAYFMIHKPLVGVWGNANDLRKMADTLDVIEEGILNVYYENLVDDSLKDVVKEMVDKETWLTGVEAGKYFNVEVGESNDMVACVSQSLWRNYINKPQNLQIVDKLEEQKADNNELQLIKARAEALLLL